MIVTMIGVREMGVNMRDRVTAMSVAMPCSDQHRFFTCVLMVFVVDVSKFWFVRHLVSNGLVKHRRLISASCNVIFLQDFLARFGPQFRYKIL